MLSDDEKKDFIGKFISGENSLKEASDDIKKQFAEYVEEGCAKDWPIALEAMGYSCYGGNEVFECDWVKSRDTLLRLIDLVGDEAPFAYNTLGYIYYYGRCTDGVPDYDKAFKYFSVGYMHGVYESMYKLADMYSLGRGVPQSKAAAFKILSGMYHENLNVFCNGNYDGKFADVALRVGGLFEKGEGVEQNYKEALAHYTEAKLAIETRIEKYDFYGDRKVRTKITESLERVKKLIEPEFFTDTIEMDEPFMIGLLLSESAGLDVEIEMENGEYYINAKRVVGENMMSQLLMTFPEVDYCKLSNEVRLKIINMIDFEVDDLPVKAFITDILCCGNGSWAFCIRDQVMLQFSCDGFIFDPNDN